MYFMIKKSEVKRLVRAWARARYNEERTAEIWLYNAIQAVSLGQITLAKACVKKACEYASEEVFEILK